MQPILFFDLETHANPAALALLPEPKAPANLKDPAKIAAAVEEKKAERIAQAALDPDTGVIAALGFRRYPDGPTTACLVGDEGLPDEAALIARFWAELAAVRGRSAGYNVLGFDFPFLQRRSMSLGLRPAMPPVLAKYRTEPVTDLMASLFNWGPAKGLKTIAKLYGLPNPLPDINGSMVAEMDAATLRRYVANDVNLAVALFESMDGIFWPAVLRHAVGAPCVNRVPAPDLPLEF